MVVKKKATTSLSSSPSTFQMMCRLASPILPTATIKVKREEEGKTSFTLSSIDVSNVAMVRGEVTIDSNLIDISEDITSFTLDIKDVEGEGEKIALKDNYFILSSPSLTYRYPLINYEQWTEMPNNKFNYPPPYIIPRESLDLSPIYKSINKRKDLSLAIAFQGRENEGLFIYDEPSKLVELRVETEVTNSFTSKFSPDYIDLIFKAVKEFQEVSIYLSHNYPIKVECRRENLSMTFFLAPRIEEG